MDMRTPLVGLILVFAQPGSAEDEAPPQLMPGGMNRAYFANAFVDLNERKRIAEVMCGETSFLMQCTGALTQADRPEFNGRPLQPAECKRFFLDQLSVALDFDGDEYGIFYRHMPPAISNVQAVNLRETLVQNIHAGAVAQLLRQGAPVSQDEACGGRLQRGLEDIRATNNPAQRAEQPE